MGLIQGALTYRKVTLLFTAALILWGAIGYRFIPKQENPQVPTPAAIVITIYPGASPEEVETLVTSKIEDAVVDIPDFENVSSVSRNSVSIVIVRLVATATDVEKAWDELEKNIRDVEGELPDQCERPELNTKLGETTGFLLPLSGEGFTYGQLTGFAEEFQRALNRVDGISRVDVLGEVKNEVRVSVDADRLNLYNLSIEQVHGTLRMQNLAIPSGFLEKDGIKINVVTPGTFETLRDIEDTIVNVSQASGHAVRLKDIATVELVPERGVSRLRRDRQNAVVLAGYFKPGRNVVLIGDDVRAVINDVKHGLPPRLQVHEAVFQPADVAHAVSGFMGSLLQGVLLVILVVFLGMGLRNAIVVSTAIPISVMLTFVIMGLTGIEVHQMSTTALIISLGMLVDNAIVIADAIQVRVDEGMSRYDAALDGARDSALPVFSATLTTVAAYSPLLFLPGAAGRFSIAVPIVVMISLSCSYLVAMLVTPTLGMLIFRPTKDSIAAGGQPKIGIFRRVFSAMLAVALRHRVLTVFVGVAALVGAMQVQKLLGLAFFPNADKDFAHLYIQSELADLDHTDALAAEVEAYLQTVPEITGLTTRVGEGLPKFFFTIGQRAQSDNLAHIHFQFDLDKSERFERPEDLTFFLQDELANRLAGATVDVKLLALAGEAPAPIVIRVSGPDLDRLQKVASDLRAAVEKTPGTYDVSDDASQKVLQLKVDVDEDVATGSGISKYDILRQINIALYGSETGVFRSGGKELDIIVTSDITDTDELMNLAVKSRFGPTKMMLKQLADVSLEPAVETIKRFQRERSIAVLSRVRPGFSAAAVTTAIETDALPTVDTDGTTITFDGERERIKSLFGGVAIAAIVAMFMVYLILFVQFNSFLRPLVILVTVPLSAVGSILGLYLFKQPMSFTAVMGMASLIGIVVNNAILLIDYIDKARGAGARVDRACYDAMGKRFRPIMLSTTTTALGLLPLVITYNPLFTPMSISLMVGLLVSTLLTLIIIPVMFSLVFRREDKGTKADLDFNSPATPSTVDTMPQPPVQPAPTRDAPAMADDDKGESNGKVDRAGDDGWVAS
jgi:multidrug efflux pump